MCAMDRSHNHSVQSIRIPIFLSDLLNIHQAILVRDSQGVNLFSPPFERTVLNSMN
jgi:hypothetical protein